jgi:hypothetical protein
MDAIHVKLAEYRLNIPKKIARQAMAVPGQVTARCARPYRSHLLIYVFGGRAIH